MADASEVAETNPVPSTLSELAQSAAKKTEEKKETAKELCQDMMEKIAAYINGELTSK